MKSEKLLIKICSYAILGAVCVAVMFPLVYIFAASFKTNTEILTNPGSIIPESPSAENYRLVWTSENFKIGTMLWNSIYYTLCNVAIAVIIASMSGYVFARGSFPGKKLIFACFTALMFVKTGGLEISPKFQILNLIHLNKGLIALIFLNMFSIPVVNMYLVKGFVESLPFELDEAAQLDGCSFMQTFFRIIMPLLKPILATIAMLTFQGSWNDYLMPTIFTITRPEQQTLIVGLMALKSTTGAATNWNLMLAGSVIALLPVLVAYSIGNRYFVSGLASGAVKG